MHKTIYRKYIDYILAHFSIIEVQPGEGLFNNRCHQNVVQYARKHKQDNVAMVYMVDNSDVILHFVNIEKDKFIDNTIGYEQEDYTYYFVKKCPAVIRIVYDDFQSARKFIQRQLPWYLKLFFRQKSKRV